MRVLKHRRPLAVLVVALASVMVAGLTAAVGGPAPSASAQVAASLRVTPQPFIGGQQLTWHGNLGVRGSRPVVLQRNLNRRGDQWKDVRRVGTSNGDGSFRFTFPGPVMDQIKFRVRSRRVVTPAVVFHPKAQEALLTQASPAVAGKAFTMAVDTVPDLRGRINLPGPVLPGRGVQLQRREHTAKSRLGYASPWRTVATSSVNYRGQAQLTTTEARSGTYAYRARLTDWTESGDRVGWLPSFPVSVNVRATSARSVAGGARGGAGAAAETDGSSAPSPTQGQAARSTIKNTAGTNSGSTFRWNPARFDFDWPYGESLDSKPFRGTLMRGRWVDWSTGNGRAVLGNGALELVSQRRSSDQRDYGSTGATLRGNAAAYGRWEVRLRTRPSETHQKDFRTLVELVPNAARRYRCGADVIKVADVRPHGSRVRFGAKSRAAGKRWDGQRGGVNLNNRTHMYAVEVAPDHITWFMDGKVISTVRNRQAAPNFARTLRVRLVGKGDRNRMKAAFDWVRGFPLKNGSQVRWGRRPAVKDWRGGC